MEKTIYIDEKPVRLKSTAGTPKRYKAQFRKDYFADLLKLAKVFNQSSEKDGLDLSKLSFEDLDHLDFEPIFNFVWVLAKTADRTIPEPEEWLDGFEEFPLSEIMPQIMDLLSSSIQSKKKLTK